MSGRILPNNNKRCYSNFSSTFREVNTPIAPLSTTGFALAHDVSAMMDAPTSLAGVMGLPTPASAWNTCYLWNPNGAFPTDPRGYSYIYYLRLRKNTSIVYVT
jgi:hypothetical protein